MQYDRESLAWLAGLFEGEGSFSLLQADSYPLPRAKVSCTDKDVIERIYRIVGFGSMFEAPQAEGYKMQWQWQIASFEGVQAFVCLVWEWLCERRRARATEVLIAMKEYYRTHHRAGKSRPLNMSGSIK
jgi:hypothetical protein